MYGSNKRLPKCFQNCTAVCRAPTTCAYRATLSESPAEWGSNKLFCNSILVGFSFFWDDEFKWKASGRDILFCKKTFVMLKQAYTNDAMVKSQVFKLFSGIKNNAQTTILVLGVLNFLISLSWKILLWKGSQQKSCLETWWIAKKSAMGKHTLLFIVQLLSRQIFFQKSAFVTIITKKDKQTSIIYCNERSE